MRFRLPSEHRIEGYSYDVEMQIILNDTQQRAVQCTSHMGTFSLFFNKTTETKQNNFWDWLSIEDYDFDFDLGEVFNKSAATKTMIIGYQGSDSQPDCTLKWCWYLAKQMDV